MQKDGKGERRQRECAEERESMGVGVKKKKEERKVGERGGEGNEDIDEKKRKWAGKGRGRLERAG